MRKDIVAKKKHSIPTLLIPQYFWDFYVLNLLYLQSGCQAQDAEINPEIEDYPKKNFAIRDAYFSVVHTLFPALMDALERSCRSEARHAFGGSEYYWYGQSDDDDKRIESPYIKFRKKRVWTVSMELINNVFKDTINWEDGYGGVPWAKGSELFLKLEKMVSHFNPKLWSVAIDQIFDLYHNNGFMLDKTEFAHVHDWALNVKKHSKSLEDLLLNAFGLSPSVRFMAESFLNKQVPCTRSKNGKVEHCGCKLCSPTKKNKPYIPFKITKKMKVVAAKFGYEYYITDCDCDVCLKDFEDRNQKNRIRYALIQAKLKELAAQ